MSDNDKRQREALYAAGKVVKAQGEGQKLRAEGKPTEAIHHVTKAASRARDGRA